MKFSVDRSLAAHQSLRPDVEAILRGLPATALFHDAHDLKHPLTQYRLSLAAIEEAWLRVLDLHERARLAAAMELQETGETELSGAYRQLLERLNEHFDAAHSILRSLRPPIPAKAFNFHTQFLDKTSLPGWRAFKDGVQKKYRDARLGRVVNLLKHDQAQLRSVRLLSDDTIALGFYVEGARGAGTIGPHKKVHALWRDCETAYSYAFDMLTHFLGIFQVAEALQHCVALTIKQDHRLDVAPVYLASEPGNRWSKLCIALSNLPLDFFPDEREQRRPVVACYNDASALKVSAEAPGRWPRLASYEVTSTIVPQEGALSVIVPYFNKRPNPYSASGLEGQSAD